MERFYEMIDAMEQEKAEETLNEYLKSFKNVGDALADFRRTNRSELTEVQKLDMLEVEYVIDSWVSANADMFRKREKVKRICNEVLNK